MARLRHGRSRSASASADSALPAWAQRHLDEAAGRRDPGGGGPAGSGAVEDPAGATTPSGGQRRYRRSASDGASRLRGWGFAAVSVAAAVGVVPLAISSLAGDHSGDPLPKVDTYDAGAPQPLPAGTGPADAVAGHPVTAATLGSDPAIAGVLSAPQRATPPVPAPRRTASSPPENPVVRGPAVPAAVMTTTPPTSTGTPTTTTPRPSTPPTSTTSTEKGRSTSKPSSSDDSTGSRASERAGSGEAPSESSEDSTPSPKRQGLLPAVGNTVGGVTDGLLGGG